MPKFEFIGTRGSGYNEMYLYKNLETGKTMEVPSQVANPRDKELATFEQKKRALQEENHNANRYRTADRPTPGLFPFPDIPATPAGDPDFARASSRSTPEMRRQQDVQQVPRNRANATDLAQYSHQVLKDFKLPPVASAPPVEPLQKQPFVDDTPLRQLLRKTKVLDPMGQYK